ncbi:MAG: hypothetical protein JO110_18115 [Acetobacteraceae bacterium]|nr:hypothetical protein [Acetobacteraceae bacterium]
MLLVHDIPGRLRFIAPCLKGNRQQLAALGKRVRVLNNVTAASVNPITGSLIIHYDSDAAVRARILQHIRAEHEALERTPAAARFQEAPAGHIRAATDFVADALANWLVERVVQCAVSALT